MTDAAEHQEIDDRLNEVDVKIEDMAKRLVILEAEAGIIRAPVTTSRGEDELSPH